MRNLRNSPLLAALIGFVVGCSVTQAAGFTLGATALCVGPKAGVGSVLLAASSTNSPWTAATNNSWLHLRATNTSGAGNALIVFDYDANAGATRSGALTIAGQTLTVTQAGNGYVNVNSATTLIPSINVTGLSPDNRGSSVSISAVIDATAFRL